mmetsp:Transcript_24581/g.54759  ORF Transcript_24581/g.54759 Transcript_24581/m.54759 type:complete len:499 (-) Transcript_24581:123-1619(-)|eukprot:CAMPEP_0170626608 /NCGR_PEP_ID=MMETSP0224-20130122/31458_1 /TAXON_ID=285029 /ORGANISM="Togula jolla, Strain CCCM 725" /LENGTH=498 /DNA_ID=CAMNT_0010953411 /DNA_START=21 /DNA_END=1517 /DNA_ORIENTATION=+
MKRSGDDAVPAQAQKKEHSEGKACKSLDGAECGKLTDRERLLKYIQEGRLLHPLPSGNVASFTDFSHALALCCGQAPRRGVRKAEAEKLALEIGGAARRHIVVVLCDGMGCSLLERHLGSESFLRRHSQNDRLVAVFPSTTPAALTTLATGSWPGQHGQPGWDLRDQKGCDFPGDAGPGQVQLRVLHPFIADMKSGQPASDFGFKTEDIFVEPPWTSLGSSHRQMCFINAYNSTDFTKWYRGPHSDHAVLIPETVAETLTTPEGAVEAVAFFRRGVDAVVEGIEESERQGRMSYIYLYTAHPDKHMHALGVEHIEVQKVLEGLDSELERLWKELGSRDVSLVVTADHGHVTVNSSNMVTLSAEMLDCLEYANVGVHGKGRHACFHCRSGRQSEFQQRWAACPRLRDSFLLLTVEEAAEEGLFGPDPPQPEVRPRLGDFIALSLGADTLVSPKEAQKWRDSEHAACQGAHGSLTLEEMQIPFVLCTPDSRVQPQGDAKA